MKRPALTLAISIFFVAASVLLSQETAPRQEKSREQWYQRGATSLVPGSPATAMIERQLRGRGISDPGTLRAMASVPREKFVPKELRNSAYDDRPLPIGYGQTISQPYIVAFMTAQLQPKTNQRVLEIGTGSGYQAAVLSELVAEVYTIEIVRPLAQQAENAIARAGLQKRAG